MNKNFLNYSWVYGQGYEDSARDGGRVNIVKQKIIQQTILSDNLGDFLHKEIGEHSKLLVVDRTNKKLLIFYDDVINSGRLVDNINYFLTLFFSSATKHFAYAPHTLLEKMYGPNPKDIESGLKSDNYTNSAFTEIQLGHNAKGVVMEAGYNLYANLGTSGIYGSNPEFTADIYVDTNVMETIPMKDICKELSITSQDIRIFRG